MRIAIPLSQTCPTSPTRRRRRRALTIAVAAAIGLALPAAADARMVFPSGDVVREGLGNAGASVEWERPTVELGPGSSLDGGPTCSPRSGSAFAEGTTDVDCVAAIRVCPTFPRPGVCSIDLLRGGFSVTVTRGAGPRFEAVPDRSAPADPGRDVAAVNYPLPTATDPSGVAQVTCTPPPGSDFQLGDTNVACTARDTVGNESSTAFRVNVFAPPPAAVVPAPAPPAPAAPGPAAPSPAGPVDEALRKARPVELGRRVRRSRGLVRFVVSCPKGNPVDCRGSLKVQTAGRITVEKGSRPRKLRIGAARFSLEPGERATVRVRMSRTARRALAGRRLRIRVIARTKDQAGKKLIGARTLRAGGSAKA